MITLRRAQERHHERRQQREVWHTFSPGVGADALAEGFGALELLDEVRLPPGAAIPPHRAHQDVEIVTFVREGSLLREDAMGRSGVIHAGEFQCFAAGNALRHSEMNPSRTEWANAFQLWLYPAESGLEPTTEQKRFSASDRRGGLCAVASPDARGGSLRLRQDVVVYSALLDGGQHLVHELEGRRSAWLHVVQGELALDDLVLANGDGAGLIAERSVSITARGAAEILLLDLGGPQLRRAPLRALRRPPINP